MLVRELLKKRRFDLVLTVPRLADSDINTFGRSVKEIQPNMPVALLAYDESIRGKPNKNLDPKAIDQVLLWSGDS